MGQPAAHIALVGSGKYSDVFRVRPPGGQAVIMKVSYYRNETLCDVVRRVKTGDIAGALRAKRHDSIQVGATFARVTESMMDGVSPHFVYVFCELDCLRLAPKLAPLLGNRLKELTPLQQRYNSVCFMEVFHTNMTRFLQAGRADEATLRGMIFQVLYTLAALQARLQGFRHNDLSTNNVLVKRLRRRPLLSYASAAAGSAVFYVWSTAFPALSDYDFVHVPRRAGLANERVQSGRYKVDARRNDSYDAHLFLKSVLKCIHRRRKDFPATSAFLARLKMRDEDRQNDVQLPLLRPSTLLGDDYFAPLKRRPPGAPVTPAATYSF